MIYSTASIILFSSFAFSSIGDAIRGTTIDLFLQSGTMGKLIILTLLFISIVSWAIIIERYFTFSRAFKEGVQFEKIFKEVRNLSEVTSSIQGLRKTPLVRLFYSGYNDFRARQKQLAESSTKGETNTETSQIFQSISKSEEIEGLTRSLEKSTTIEVRKLEKRLFFLATVGAISPFIGLFGTVWGIMNSFRGIGVQSSASYAIIATGISEALIATAAGLAAAIPAVIAYNYFINWIKDFITQMESFTYDFLNIIERWLRKKSF
jgi:biopolymer transport protein TolQ